MVRCRLDRPCGPSAPARPGLGRSGGGTGRLLATAADVEGTPGPGGGPAVGPRHDGAGNARLQRAGRLTGVGDACPGQPGPGPASPSDHRTCRGRVGRLPACVDVDCQRVVGCRRPRPVVGPLGWACLSETALGRGHVRRARLPGPDGRALRRLAGLDNAAATSPGRVRRRGHPRRTPALPRAALVLDRPLRRLTSRPSSARVPRLHPPALELERRSTQPATLERAFAGRPDPGGRGRGHVSLSRVVAGQSRRRAGRRDKPDG